MQIKCENLFSYKLMDLELTPGKKYLILGKNYDDPGFSSNGAGKTAIFDIVTSVLYKRTTRGSKSKTLNESSNKGYGLITLELQGTYYSIRRPFGDDTLHAIVTNKGVLMEGDYASDFEKVLEPLLPPYKIFIETTYISAQSIPSLLTGTKSDREALAKYLSQVDFDAIKEEISRRISLIQVKADGIKTTLTKLQGSFASLLKMPKMKQIPDLNKYIAVVDKLIRDLSDEQNNWRQKIEEQNRILTEKRKELQLLSEKLSIISTSKKCPTCGRKIQESTRQKIRQSILDQMYKVKKSIPDGVISSQSNIRELEELLNDLKSAKVKIQTTMSMKKSYERLQSVNVQQLEQSITETESLLNDINQTLQLYQTLKELTNEVKDISYNNIMIQLRQHFNTYLNAITAGNMSVANEEELMILKDGKKFSISQLSGGERRRCDIAMVLAMRDFLASKSSINFLFLDEVFTLLDDAGKESVSVVLKDSKDTILLTSQEEDVSNFDHVILVEKKHGISCARII